MFRDNRLAPARPTLVHHRSPENDLLEPYGPGAALATKLHALTITGGEYQTHDYYMNIGPVFADPLARQLYAEIASVESQHITHYGSMLNPGESLLEKLLVCEAAEVWNYAACLEQETNPRIKALWERFLDYELGHLQVVMRLFEEVERRAFMDLPEEDDEPEMDLVAAFGEGRPEVVELGLESHQPGRRVLAFELWLRLLGQARPQRPDDVETAVAARYRAIMPLRGPRSGDHARFTPPRNSAAATSPGRCWGWSGRCRRRPAAGRGRAYLEQIGRPMVLLLE